MVSSPVTTLQRQHVIETFDQIKAALIAFGVAKAKEFLNQAIPGLEPHLSDAQERSRQHSGTSGTSQTWKQSGSPQEAPPGGPHSWQSTGAPRHDPVSTL
jgi:hypothetical protein